MTPLLSENNKSGYPTSGSSAPDRPLQRNRWLARFGWLIPISVAIAVYCVVFNNYFTFDDFIWLNRARTFKQDWLQIFRVDVTYFDPLVHLMFWADYLVAGLYPRWYHCGDLVIHAINSLLIYRFTRLLSGDENAAIYVGILFAGSFAIADAVLWPSSRVDLLSTLCSLGALIQFLHYLRSEKNRPFIFSLLLFVLALGAKGTPLVLPLIFLWLIIQEKKPLNNALRLIPFGAIIIIYVALLKLNMHHASLPFDKMHFNIRNLAIAFSALFIPENILENVNLIITASLLLVVVSVLALSTITPLKTTSVLRRTGYFTILSGILPVLILTDFVLVTKYSTLSMLLSSPSHRIYLASVGAAILGGGFLQSVEVLLKKSFPKFSTVAVCMLLAGIVIGNAILVRERNKLWESEGEDARQAFVGLLPYRQQIIKDAQVGLINFTSAAGFLTPMLRVCFDLNDVSVLNPLRIGRFENSEDLQNAEKTYLFILDGYGQVHDKSLLFRQLQLLNRAVIQDPYRTDVTNTFQVILKKLNQEIVDLVPTYGMN